MIGESFTVRELMRRTAALIRADVGSALFAVVVMTGVAMAVGQRPNTALIDLAPFLVSIYFQYDLTMRALARLDLLLGYRTRRLIALLGLILLTRLPMLPGFLLLVPGMMLRSPIIVVAALLLMIAPAMLLLVRWFVAVPVLIVEDAGPLESLRISWEETTGRFRPIFWAALIIYLPPYLVMVGLFAVLGSQSEAVKAIVHALFYLSLVAGWYAAVAAYVMRRGGTEGLAEVFA